ncbi:leucine-rich repeat domain-containing protein [Paraneptunicella aestuarii]|uniref:leucine-rich repeat domain-containing protein n=1 Tax=Paraneptunicella aestuarii TaxID=2831148 RepID=UPI001E5B3289|nr:leucine-rich repeat domain-containing protein [Paraneptunicella aestuarii]UAA38935.1 leucine-rich repeat domain-containing protein [Paraneptunicella aestuarii]
MTAPFTPLPQFVEPDSKQFIKLHSSPLRRYLELLRQDTRFLDNQGLAMDDQEYTGSSNKITLDSLYVFPAASEKRIDPDEIIKLKKGEDREQLNDLSKVIQENPRVTLLGDPGIGKSTFIQWLSLSLSHTSENTAKRWLGELLPVVITARKLPFAGKKNTEDSNFLDTIINSMGSIGEPLKESEANSTLLDTFKTGQAILLVDGIDEISTEKSRWLSSQLKTFLTEYPGVRLILTARVVGFDSYDFWQLLKLRKNIEDEESKSENTQLSENADDSESLASKINEGITDYHTKSLYPQFYLAPFDQNRRDVYVENWTKQYLPKKSDARTFSETLRNTCAETPYLDALSRNPVLLTMICFIQWRVGQLPNGRAELYQRIVATYLVALDRARKTDIGFTPDKMAYDFDDIKLWLGKLAWQMQCGEIVSQSLMTAEKDPQFDVVEEEFQIEDSNGNISTHYTTGFQQRLITVWYSELLSFFASQLADLICDSCEGNGLPQEAIDEAKKLITFLKKRTGFLIPKGQQLNPETNKTEEFFSFSHLSFQEYFAGHYLSQQWNEWKDEHIETFQKSTNEESWIEVWQLAFEESSRTQQAKMKDVLFADIAKEKNIHTRDLLHVKVIMNPTLKFKLSDRSKSIQECWKKLSFIPDFYHESNILSYTRCLWTSNFNSTDYMLDAEIKILKLGSAFKPEHFDKLLALPTLTVLDLSNCNLKDTSHFAGLSKHKNLETLILRNNDIDDISPICNIRSLERLEIGSNHVEDFTPISNLKSLEVLSVFSQKIKNIDFIKPLRKLRMLELQNNKIQDLSAISSLKSVFFLNLDNNQIEDLTPLSLLKELQFLRINGNPIKNIKPLLKLNQLGQLTLDEEQYNTLDIDSLKKTNKNLRIYTN